ncbi:HofP DNA utilization family protein [Serratia marcescens]
MSKRPGRGWWWLLWPWALCAEPRDPFAPPPLPACAQTAASPAGWRLKGVIGQPTLRYGWVVTPAGQWLRRRPQQRVLAERWQVTQVQARSLTLTALVAEPDCPASQGDISLIMDNKDGKP